MQPFIASLSSLGEAIRDTFSPPRCMGCLKEDTWLCKECLAAQRSFKQRCIVCDKERARGLTCPHCQNQTSLTGIVSAGAYGSPLLRRGVQWLKFRGITRVAPDLAYLLLPYLALIAPLEQLHTQAALIPIPLHPRRMQQRGYNQSQLIAVALQSFIDIPVLSCLERTRATWAQAKLPSDLRGKNVDQAFTIGSPLPSSVRYTILIDDVATSGSTLQAAAQTLSQAGVREIWAATIARG